MLERGELRGAFKVGRTWRVNLDELQRFLEAQKRGE
jgi:excisionase family DNA binding protein